MRHSVKKEVEEIKMGRPHVVILGAGCSRAACPSGDANGLLLPLMDDFLSIVKGCKKLLEQNHLASGSKNFEEIYSDLVKAGHQNIQDEIEQLVHAYFESLVLPKPPTIYDYLVLSLRPKDVIATFNWDPFLVQAITRHPFGPDNGPSLLFLHGNVAVGACLDHGIQGRIGYYCPRCQKPFSPSRLLYPIENKDYQNDPMIAASWKQLGNDLDRAFMLTVFGYSAPKSDVAAIEMMKMALGKWKGRELCMMELIDTKGDEEIWATWEPFLKIHKYHYKIHSQYSNSYIARHPRRTGEAYISQYLKGNWISDNRAPEQIEFHDLCKWFEPLIDAENAWARTRQHDNAESSQAH